MMAGMAQGSARHGPRAGTRLATAVLLSLLAGACTTNDPGDGDPPRGPAQAALEVSVVEHAGPLDDQQRAEVEAGVGDVLSEYVVRAFLGEFPRDDFVPAFSAFTSRAARGAAEDIDLLTAARYKDADRVVATRLRVQISSLAAGNDVVGATAQVDLAFDVTGSAAGSGFALTGRFLLAHDGGAWSVFGYDVQRDDAEEPG